MDVERFDERFRKFVSGSPVEPPCRACLRGPGGRLYGHAGPDPFEKQHSIA